LQTAAPARLTDRTWRAAQIVRYLGPAWIAQRTRLQWQRLSGSHIRHAANRRCRLPLAARLDDPGLADPEAYLEYRRERAPVLFRPIDRPNREHRHRLRAWDAAAGRSPVTEARDILRGQFRLFSWADVQTGFPPPWTRNPFTGHDITATQHWSRLPDFAAGDIKLIWELSRFTCTFPLVRAYARTGDEAYADAFWILVEDWLDRNPPYLGPNWKCGQEVALRVLAWSFGLDALLDCDATTPHRVARLGRAIGVAADRIAANTGYALSQNNNHGISEAVGLWTVGTVFPEFRQAGYWRRLGRDMLASQVRKLVYADGSFSQQSFNYQRLMLHLLIWTIAVDRHNGRDVGSFLASPVRRSAHLLYQVQDEVSGRVPCYGQNDGALLLPLSNCDYQDYRPVVQAAHFLTEGHRAYPPGGWDEDLLWLSGRESLDTESARHDPPRRRDLAATAGGYFTIRADQSFAFVRCPVYRHRPGHADALHVDLWWRGHNIAVDAGTYSYNEPAPWQNPLAATRYHNTVTVDGRDQMQRVSRFLWLPWLRSTGRAPRQSPGSAFCLFLGEHDGYRNQQCQVRHQRALLRIGDEHWLVVDHVASAGVHAHRLHWLLGLQAWDWVAGSKRLQLETEVGRYCLWLAASGDPPTTDSRVDLVEASPDTPDGWRCRYYRCREAALSLSVIRQGRRSLFVSLFGPEESEVDIREHTVAVLSRGWQADVQLGTTTAEPPIRSARLGGTFHDELPCLA
jgi:asparagine synthase (glutamine-hydrolysing)